MRATISPTCPLLPQCYPERGPLLLSKGGGGDQPRRKRRQVRAKSRTRKKETPTVVETSAPAEVAAEAPGSAEALTEPSEAPRYHLRSKRQPRYKCGTCGRRDCVCLVAVNENRRVPIGARGVPPEREGNLVYRLMVRAEETYSAVERSGDHLVDTMLEKLSSPGVKKAPCPRFKDGLAMGRG